MYKNVSQMKRSFNDNRFQQFERRLQVRLGQDNVHKQGKKIQILKQMETFSLNKLGSNGYNANHSSILSKSIDTSRKYRQTKIQLTKSHVFQRQRESERRQSFSQMFPLIQPKPISQDTCNQLPIFTPYPESKLVNKSNIFQNNPNYAIAINKLQRTRQKLQLLTINPSRDRFQDFGFEPIIQRKFLYDKYQSVDLELLQKSEKMLYAIAQQKIDQFREKTQSLSPKLKQSFKKEQQKNAKEIQRRQKLKQRKLEAQLNNPQQFVQKKRSIKKQFDNFSNLYSFEIPKPKITKKRAYTPWKSQNEQDNLQSIVY